MRLKAFKVENYRSISSTGWIALSPRDNVTVFAGQNESGKSSILRALKEYEEGKFDETSPPFNVASTPTQQVSCTYQIEPTDDLFTMLNDSVMKKLKLPESDGPVLDQIKLSRIKEFTLTRKQSVGKLADLTLDNASFQILKAAYIKKVTVEDTVDADAQAKTEPDEKQQSMITEDNAASVFWVNTPKIIFFDDFCDLLPDKILISDLVGEKKDAQGYKAVKNLESILRTDFTTKDGEADPIRRTKESAENQALSVDFQADWGQRIHPENQVKITYNYEKRTGQEAEGSYINFFVETKEGQPLAPKQRSKGLIWFLSLWQELKSQGTDLVLLDEPDQHLHVKAQKDILKLINKLASEHNQIIYATHSPYLIEIEKLNRVKLIVNSKNEGTLVEDINTSKIDSENKKDALQPIADAIGLTVGEFSPLNQKNILVEGLSDFYYFSAMKKILKIKNDYSIVPGVGLRKLNGLISLCLGYGMQWVVIMDDDPTVGGKDSITKYQEISNFVFDGDADRTKASIHVLTGIAGIENMFSIDELKLVDPNIVSKPDKCESVGMHRKIIFAKLFFEKVNAGEIKESHLSTAIKDRFAKAFDFCAKALG